MQSRFSNDSTGQLNANDLEAETNNGRKKIPHTHTKELGKYDHDPKEPKAHWQKVHILFCVTSVYAVAVATAICL